MPSGPGLSIAQVTPHRRGTRNQVNEFVRRDNAKHSWLQDIERVCDLRELTVLHIQPTKNNHYGRAGNDECEARENSTE